MQQNMCHIFLFVAFLVATSLCDTSPLLTQRDIENLKRRVDWKVADYNENIFRGWNKDEFRTLLGDFEDDYVPPLGFAYLKPKLWNLPREIDWSYSYCVHGIRDQMTCGACWAFAAATVVSDRCCLQNRDFGWLSPQELISCDTIKNSGCKGGLAAEALQYITGNLQFYINLTQILLFIFSIKYSAKGAEQLTSMLDESYILQQKRISYGVLLPLCRQTGKLSYYVQNQSQLEMEPCLPLQETGRLQWLVRDQSMLKARTCCCEDEGVQ
eukprot:TRINITY_DN1497_c0_g1_i5.p1 TRINITY_DN1497_c0_g1~~TRINITY_DN1497_c0_g1_i5.p1  ORF type:complete len:269 (-),score=-12.09 TRINITY_DN1497_c0_g1_i5:427-1233(-)